ncbi:MAG: hypothetical protein M3Y87_03185 [Myxococcota bacterium]|nr:hypothetical protein [Myxococcota bacterium]
MSSDTFDVEIRALDGTTVELALTTTTAGGANDYAITRSFALITLQSATRERADAPLTIALAALAPDGVAPVWSEHFHREHVGAFVARTELLSRTGFIENAQRWFESRASRALELEAAGLNGDLEAALDREFPRHNFLLRVDVTDPRWLSGLSPGQRFRTTGFDAWWDDPLRPVG